MAGPSVMERVATWPLAIVGTLIYGLSNTCTSACFIPIVDTVIQCPCPVCRICTNSLCSSSKFIVNPQVTSAGFTFFRSFCPYRNYSPVPVEVQTKSCVSTCYRPDYFIEHTCREPVGFYRPVPGVLLHTVTGVSTCNRCRTDLYGLYRSVQEGACKEYMTVACVKQNCTDMYSSVQERACKNI